MEECGPHLDSPDDVSPLASAPHYAGVMSGTVVNRDGKAKVYATIDAFLPDEHLKRVRIPMSMSAL